MKLPYRDYHILCILNSYLQQNKPLDVFLNSYLRSHKSIGANDRRIICESVYTIMRWKGLFEFLSPKPFAFEHCLHSNINELRKQNLPDHVKVSFPEEYFNKVSSHYGRKKALEICLESNFEAPATIRANLLKITREELLNRWKNKFLVSPCQFAKTGIVFHKKINFFELEEFKRGFFEVQDEGSQLISELIEIKEGEQFLDFCAGSGGKTLAIAAKMKNSGQIYLHDSRPFILQEAKKRLKRAGVQNAQISLDLKFQNKMDWILLDVPCSGSGTLRRNPDLKWKFRLNSLQDLVQKQREIFDKAFPFLRKKGKIVYATCSLFPEENEEQVEFFQKKYNLKLLSKFSSLPTKNSMDGFFGAVFNYR